MDDLTARLWAEKTNRPSADEKVAHEETLRRLSEDLELFLAAASANWGGSSRSAARPPRTGCSGLSAPYLMYDVGNALTRHCREA